MEADEQQDHTEDMKIDATRPIARFTGTGGLTVAIWKKETESGAKLYSVKLEKSYRGEDEQFHSTPYLRDSDLLRAERLLQQADEWIEHDKGRQRTYLFAGRER